MTVKGSLSYSPRWASHVVGYYDPREVDPMTGEAEPQIINIECAKCHATHRATCNSGAVRTWINHFATAHIHVDTLDPARVQEMANAKKRGT